MVSRETSAAWPAVTAACLRSAAVVLFVIALVAGGSVSVVLGLGFAALGLLLSSVTLYRQRTRKRP
jgi:hypothetical protein